MVRIDAERCTRCGSCVKVCHEHCMTLADSAPAIDYRSCSTCCQCVAICPRQALSWDGRPPAAFEPGLLPTVAQVQELLAQRRTVRTFSAEPVDRAVIAEIVSWGAYAPTHNFHLRCVAVDDPRLIAAFDRAAFRFSARVYRLVFRPRLVRWLVSLCPPAVREEFFKALSKLQAVVRRGRGFDNLPPVLVCVVGDRRTPLSLESAQYALYNMALISQARGLGCRNLVGNQAIFNRSRELRAMLGLRRTESIFAIAGFGHPAVRFRNKVVGRAMSVRWAGNGAGSLE